MAVRPTRASDVSRLVQDLTGHDDVRRESAAARLAVIGARAVTVLNAVATDAVATVPARSAALRALAAIGDIRAVATAVAILDGGPEALVLESIDVLGAVVQRKERQATIAFERLTALALNQRADAEHRLASVGALESLPPRLLEPLRTALAKDPDPRLAKGPTRLDADITTSVARLVEGGLPADPNSVLAVVRRDDQAGPAALRRAIEAVRQREGEVNPGPRAAWQAVRGEIHQALATRGSRIAVYDLRESFERAKGPLPVGFTGAVAVVGDASCLDAIAGAWIAAEQTPDRVWRDQLADAFGGIVRRERMTRRHRTLKQILQRWPASGVLVAKAAKA